MTKQHPLIPEEPPSVILDSVNHPASTIYLNLVELVDSPGAWGRISTHPRKVLAQNVIYDLRNGKRRLPSTHQDANNWEFASGPVTEGDTTEYGVWARLKPIESEGANDTETDVGGEHQS